MSGILNIWVIVITSIQYVLLVGRQNIPIPKEFETFRNYLLILFNLEFNIAEHIPKEFDWIWYAKFDFRIQFIVLCCMIPTAICFILLMEFGDFYATFSFSMMTIASFAMVIGFFSSMNVGWLLGVFSAFVIIFAVGGMCVSLRNVMFRIFWVLIRFEWLIYDEESRKTDTEKNFMKKLFVRPVERYEKRKNNIEKLRITEVLRYGIIVSSTFILGLLFSGALRFRYFEWLWGYVDLEDQWQNSPFFWIFPVISVLFFFCSLLNLVFLFMSLCLCGRKLILKIQELLHTFTVRSLLFLLFLLYTPIITTLVSSFVCETINCPPGTHPRQRHLSGYKKEIEVERKYISPLFKDYERIRPHIFIPDINKHGHVQGDKFDQLSNSYWGFPPNARNNWTYDPMDCVSCGYGEPNTYSPGGFEIREYENAFRACPARRLLVLHSDRTIPCARMGAYFMWGAAIMLVLWLLVPIVVIFMVHTVVTLIQHIPLEEIREMKPPPPKGVIQKVETKLISFRSKLWKIISKPIPKRIMDFYYDPERNIPYSTLDLFLAVLEGAEYTLFYFMNYDYKQCLPHEDESVSIFVRPIRKRFKFEMKKGFSDDWTLRISLLKNKVKEVYGNYEFRMRYWMALELVFKALVTIISVAFVRIPAAAVIILTLIHCCNVFSWFFFQPYIIFFTDVISFTLALVVLLNHFWFTLNLIWVPPAWMYIILAFNVIMPILGIIATVLFCFARTGRLNIRKNDERYLKVKEQVEETDRTINFHSIKLITAFFFVVGTVSVFVMAFTFLSFNSNPRGYVPSKRSAPGGNCETLKHHAFAGRDEWHDFTRECICQEDPYLEHTTYDWNVRGHVRSELWHCIDGTKKIRLRVENRNGEEVSGLHLRRLCSPRFNGVNETQIPDPVCTESPVKFMIPETFDNATEYAREYLW